MNSAASAIAMCCKIWLFARLQKQWQQHLHHYVKKKREVDQEEFVVTCLLCATAIPLYPSPTFAVNRTSSQSARDRNSRGGTQRLLQLLAFFCYSSLRVCLLPSSLTVLCGFLCDQTSFICDQTKWFEGKFFLQFLDMREINFGRSSFRSIAMVGS
jgi:hypothetical protein